MAAAAICKLVGGRATTTTAGPDGPLCGAVTAATGVTAAPRKAVVGARASGAAAPTVPANTRGAIMPTLEAGVHIARIIFWRNDLMPRWLSGRASKAVNGLDTKAGSFA
jgi:hypothetical protein